MTSTLQAMRNLQNKNKTNNPGGAIMQLVPHAINRHHPVTLLRRIHSLYPAFVKLHCMYELY